MEVDSFTHKHIVKCVRFSYDGKLLLTGSNEKLLRIFDLDKSEAGASSQQTIFVHNRALILEFSQFLKNAGLLLDSCVLK